MAYRFGSKFRSTFGVVQGAAIGVLAFLLGVRTHDDHLSRYISIPLVGLAVVLSFLGVNLIVREMRLLRERVRTHTWREPEAIGAIAVFSGLGFVMIVATLIPRTQNILLSFLRELSKIPHLHALSPGDQTYPLANQRSGLVAFCIVIALTNWIWNHPIWKGRIRDNLKVPPLSVPRPRFRKRGDAGRRERQDAEDSGVSMLPGRGGG